MPRTGPGKVALLAALLLAAVAPAAAAYQEQAGSAYTTVGPSALVIRIEGMIDESMLDYLRSAIDRAEGLRVPLIVLLNTPGGWLEAATDMVIAIERSRVPVVSFVVEKWAMSAGTLILVCSHVAAMQPGTIIGSMQPIQYDPTRGTYTPVNESKIINPILEFLSEHAGNKGRNLTAIHKFVTENLNLGAREAIEYGVIDVVARTLPDLLRQLDGRVVPLPYYEVNVTITSDGSYEEYKPSLRVIVAHTLSDPLLSSVLLSLGLMIILFSLISGHLTVTPIGVMLLLLGLLGSGFSINLTVMGLLALGAVLVGVELVTPGFGVIGVTGIVMLALGIAMLPAGGGFSVSREYAVSFLYAAYGIGAVIGGFFGIAVYKVIQARRRKPFIWTIEGKAGRAVDPIGPGKRGFVVIDGEYWEAESEEEIDPGSKVIVVKKEGPVLIVKRYSEEASAG